MEGIYKRRFYTWLMWGIPICLTGLFSFYIWTFIQMHILFEEEKQYRLRKRPIFEDDEIIRINTPSNLSKEDKDMLKALGNYWYKESEDCYVFDVKSFLLA